MAKKTTKTATKKVATKKVAAKKAPVKKVAAKTVASETVAAPKAAVVAPTPAEPLKGAAPAKRTSAKPATPLKGAPTKKVQETTIIARVDVGFGNSLYLRGEGAGLNWDQGILMENVTPYEWVFKTTQAKTGVVFKFLINDDIWADGENLNVSAGSTSISSPAFTW